MVVFPNAKINIGLQVTEKRSDGYHNIQTIFYPLPVKDVLEIIPAQHTFEFSVSGKTPVLQKGINLCEKAYYLISEKYGPLPACKLHLHKELPAGGGLGGGSSNGTFTLMLLNDFFRLGLNTKELSEMALQLGSDCPFFVYNLPCYATGRGEHLEPLSLDLSTYKICLMNPGFSISTAEAFGKLPELNKNAAPLKEVVRLPISEWRNHISNDFEKSVFPAYPVLEHMKAYCYAQGALYASMSGTGSTMYAIFKKQIELPELENLSYFIKWV